jgi:hypothetical protein
MSIKRYIANKDNTITNAFKDNLITRASGSNMGASDILEVFSIYGQASTSSLEKARVLVQFPTSEISTDRTNSNIPASGSVNFVLKMSNAEHSSTTPENFTLSVHVVTSASWDEGYGIDMETYKNTGASNWISSSTGNAWNTEGADYLTSSYAKHVSFDKGTENLEVDISDIVEDWLDSSIPNYGLLVKLSGSAEDGSLEKSFYTKKFFARSSHHFFKRPSIEARWNDSIQDDRGSVIKSSSLAPAAENVNNIYLYNKIRGNFRDIPGLKEAPHITGSHLLVQFVSSLGAAAVTASGPTLNIPTTMLSNELTYVSASSTYIAARKTSETGIYKVQFAYSGSHTALHDIWTKRQITGDSLIVLGQENKGASGNTSVDFSGVTGVTSDTSAFVSGSDTVYATLNIRVTGTPSQNEQFTLQDQAGASQVFIFKTDNSTFNDDTNLDSGKFIIGIQGATHTHEVARRLSLAVPASSLEIENTSFTLDHDTDVYTQLYTGSSFTVGQDISDSHYPTPEYVVNITNLKPSYHKEEVANFRVYTRSKDWQPTIYTVAKNAAPVNNIREGYYKIKRQADNYVVIPYSTGSTPSYSKLSYDVSGSYFDLDMSILEPNYLYEISFLRKENSEYIEQKEKFKFRVDP